MKLNERNARTEKNLHLMITDKCDRDCKYCCNKQYNINDVPFVTSDELRAAENIYLTGGEPFTYSEPNYIAYHIKFLDLGAPKKVFVYTNAYEFIEYIKKHFGNDPCFGIDEIDGLDISIKDSRDFDAWQNNSWIWGQCSGGKNRLYTFIKRAELKMRKGYTLYKREWQKDFEPADDSIFRRL